MTYSTHAPGGRRLHEHAADPIVSDLINSQAWDYVVIQEQSQLPAYSPKEVDNWVMPYAQTLSQKIKNANPHTRIVFFQTGYSPDTYRNPN